MTTLMGPVLGFRGAADDRWKVSVPVVAQGDAPRLSAERAAPSEVHADVLDQLASSAIVPTPPPGVVDSFLEHVAGREEEIDRGLTARMLAFPGPDERFLGARNWRELETDEQGRLWASGQAEGQEETTPDTKGIHPAGRPAEA